MNFKFTVHLFLTVTLLFSVSTFFSFKNLSYTDEVNFTFNIDEFYLQSTKLSKVANDYKLGNVDESILKAVFLNTRQSYKKIEFMVSYLYPSYAESNLNGAPLLHTEDGGENPILRQPEGLQVLDEIIFGDNLKGEKSQVFVLSKKLEGKVKELASGSNIISVNGSNIFEAYRQGLITIFTLGITGFDTPGSLNALKESEIALLSIYESSQQFLIENTDTDQKIKQYFEKGIKLLKDASGFDYFDRLTFLQESINPLYKFLLLKKKELGFKSENSPYKPRNVNADNIFSEDFLSPYFYNELSVEEDNGNLKELGKLLFRDSTLSGKQNIACISCHNPSLGFTDGQEKSMSNNFGQVVLRNSPTLLNSVFADRYFYDLRAFTLKQQVEHVIFNKDEFDTEYAEILLKLKSNKLYKQAFKSAFGSAKMSRDKIVTALTSYVSSLISFNSPFDQYMRGEKEDISDDVKKGFNLFTGKANCATCHFVPTFSGLVPPLFQKSETEILGVLEDPNAKTKKIDTDLGRYNNNVLSEKSWIYKRSFKTATIRNVKLTAPYFHNGAYYTLKEVMDFYNKGGGIGHGFEVPNQTLSADTLGLSDNEINAIIQFMESLTDTSYLNIK